ncbi:MAG: type II secretion system F family protein [Alphaproteobacteria bacterium]|nr:type II secretion system F family protein [Alphaproteobacteria bacterium]
MFHYKALARTGEFLAGEIEASDSKNAIALLQDQGHLPISASPSRPPNWVEALVNRLGRVGDRNPSSRDIALLTQQMAALIGAGLTVDRALVVLTDAAGARNVRELTQDLRRRVRSGAALSQALQVHGGVFPRFYWATVQAAEQGGFLDAALTRLASFLARSESLRSAVRSALVYPAVLLVMAGASILVILIFVIPQFRPLIEDSGITPSLSLSALMAASAVAEDHLALATIAITLAIVLAVMGAKRLRNSEWADTMTLRVPVLRSVVTCLEIARFTRTLGMLVENGVALPASIELSGTILRNRRVAAIAADAAVFVKEGKRLADSLRHPVVPQAVVEFVRVGEETGKLPDLLTQAADLLDQDVQRLLDRLMALLVPALTVFLGLIIAGLVASILTALISVNQMVG